MKNFIILFSILFLACFTQAQEKNNREKQSSEKDKTKLIDRLLEDNSAHYEDEINFGLRFHTNGFSGVIEKVWIKNIYKKHLLQFEYFHHKDFREKKQKSQVSENNLCNSRKYFFGKQNSFFAIRALYGNRKLIADKFQKSGVRLMMTYAAGISLGFEKPYYLEIVPENGLGSDCRNHDPMRFDTESADAFLDNTRIFGASGIGKGFNEIRPLPGGHAKFGLNFDWANQEHFVKAIEVGAQLDVFYRKVNILVEDDFNKPYIFNLYLSVLLGKRW